MEIYKDNGITVSIDSDKFFEFIENLPKKKQVDLMFHILEYDDGDILKSLAKKKYNDCIKCANNNIELSNSNSFSEFLRNSYVQVADEYKAEAEIWKQFLK
jgi:hypothetical protein